MVGNFRCSCGHSWKAASLLDRPEPCPCCGNPVAVQHDSNDQATGQLTGQPASQDQTHALLTATSREPCSEAEDPSFSSLAGVIPEKPDPFAVTQDASPQGREAGQAGLAASPVSGYELQEEIGRGGMGVVYRARHVGLNRPVALKMILAGSHAGPVERERFRREAQAVAALQHPQIVQIFEIGESSGHAYFALELVEGGSLAQHLKGDPWPARESAELVELLARAVEYAHSQGVIHRDLKPGNVLLSFTNASSGASQGSRSGTGEIAPSTKGNRMPALIPKITDFGLAKRVDEAAAQDGATKTGAVMGTPSYIAPEQASGKTREIGRGVDVYSLGAILYELLTGRPPFRGETPLDTVLQVIHEDPVSPKSLQPNIPWDLQTICLKCLNKNPAKRYPSAQALSEDLRRYLNGEPIQARPLSGWGRGVKWARRHPALAVLGAATITATIALLSVLSIAYARVSEAKSQKEDEAREARQARDEEEIQRLRAEGFAEENRIARIAAVAQAEQLKKESERNRRGAYALQIAQIAAMCERDPKRARTILENPNRCPPDLRDFSWAYLHRLCDREERIYAEHAKGDDLAAVAVAHHGTFVATAGKKGQFRVWDLRTGHTYAVGFLKTPINGLAFSPEGTMLATASGKGTVQIWAFPARMLNLTRVAFTRIDLLKEFVKPYHLAPILTLFPAKNVSANCVAFSPNGRVLAAGFSDGKVRYWQLDGWRPNHFDIALLGGAAATAISSALNSTFPRFDRGAALTWVTKAPVRCLAFSPSGSKLAVGFADHRLAVLFAADRTVPVLLRGNSEAETRRSLERSAGAVAAVAFTPDDRTLISVNNGSTPTIRLIDARTWKDDRRLIGHVKDILALAVSPDGAMLASGSADGSVRIWDMEDGHERATLLGHEGNVRSVAFGKDRRTVLSAGSDGTVRVWLTGARPSDSADLSPSRDGLIAAASVNGPGSSLIAADGNGRVMIRLLQLFPGRLSEPGVLPLIPLPLHFTGKLVVHAVAAFPNGRGLIAADDKSLLIWQSLQIWPKGGRSGMPAVLPIARPIIIPTPSPIRAAAIDLDCEHLATLDREGLRIWNLRAKQPIAPPLLLAAPDVQSMAFHPSGHRLALARSNLVQIIDLAGKVLAEVEQSMDSKPGLTPGLAAGSRITSLAFDPEGRLLATGDANGLIRTWQVSPNGQLAHQADLPGHTGAVKTLCFTRGGRSLASGGVDRTVVLWDPLTGQERLTLTGHADRLVLVQFATNGRSLITLSRDGAVKRWRAESSDPARERPRFPFPKPRPRGKRGRP